MALLNNAPQLPPLPTAETIASSLSLREALEIVLADLPPTADPNTVAYMDLQKAIAIQRRLAARLVLKNLADTQP